MEIGREGVGMGIRGDHRHPGLIGSRESNKGYFGVLDNGDHGRHHRRGYARYDNSVHLVGINQVLGMTGYRCLIAQRLPLIELQRDFGTIFFHVYSP